MKQEKTAVETITIRDVAKKAGVSHTTISQVINNSGRISVETRQRIWKVINDMKYYPNDYARKLAVGKRDTIAFVSPRLAAPFISSVLAGFEDRAYSQNKYIYGIEQYSTRSVESLKKDLLMKILYSKKISALVMLSLKPDEQVLELYKERKIPVVLIENEMPGACSVKVDNEQGAYQAVDYLAKKGRKKIAIITGEVAPSVFDEEIGSTESSERLVGYNKAIADNGLKTQNSMIYKVHFHSENEGADGLKALLKNEPGLDAVFCAAGDIVAAGVIKQAKILGVKVPEDIAVIGYDDMIHARLISPTLTTVNQPIAQMGSKAFDMAVEAVEKEDMPVQKMLFKAELVIRESA